MTHWCVSILTLAQGNPWAELLSFNRGCTQTWQSFWTYQKVSVQKTLDQTSPKFCQRNWGRIPSWWCMLACFAMQVISCHGDSFSGIRAYRGIFRYPGHCSSIERVLKMSFLYRECLILALLFFFPWQRAKEWRSNWCKRCIARMMMLWLVLLLWKEHYFVCSSGWAWVRIFSKKWGFCKLTKLILGQQICASQTHITYMCLWFTNTKLILGSLHCLVIIIGWGMFGCRLVHFIHVSIMCELLVKWFEFWAT